MAVKIRLRRMGKKKEVHYRVVVAEASSAREGEFIEIIGYVNPRMDPPQVRLDEAKARTWLSRGAQPTDTVRDILQRQGILVRAGATASTPEAQAEVVTENPPSIGEEVAADAGTDRDGGEGAG
jgi:small subunit ribosomal protein S16